MDQNTLSDVFVSKFEIDGNTLYANILWKPKEHDLFHIKIYDNGTTWTGRFSNHFATKFRERIGENIEDYHENIMKALAGDGTLYTYELKVGEGNTKTFRWQRKYENGGLMVYGCVALDRDDTPVSKDELINILLLQNNLLRRTIKCLNRKNEQIDKDLDKCKNELEQFVNIKVSLETSLYGKFVQLLNAKKRRIQLLEDNLHKFEEPNKDSCDNELD